MRTVHGTACDPCLVLAYAPITRATTPFERPDAPKATRLPTLEGNPGPAGAGIPARNRARYAAAVYRRDLRPTGRRRTLLVSALARSRQQRLPDWSSARTHPSQSRGQTYCWGGPLVSNRSGE